MASPTRSSQPGSKDEELTGNKKVAILLVSLDKNCAAAILQQLDESKVESERELSFRD